MRLIDQRRLSFSVVAMTLGVVLSPSHADETVPPAKVFEQRILPIF